MTVFIQQIESEDYMGKNGDWVHSATLARNFQTSIRALDYCFDHRLAQVQIRACFKYGVQDIVWGVTPSSEAALAPW